MQDRARQPDYRGRYRLAGHLLAAKPSAYMNTHVVVRTNTSWLGLRWSAERGGGTGYNSVRVAEALEVG